MHGERGSHEHAMHQFVTAVLTYVGYYYSRYLMCGCGSTIWQHTYIQGKGGSCRPDRAGHSAQRGACAHDLDNMPAVQYGGTLFTPVFVVLQLWTPLELITSVDPRWTPGRKWVPVDRHVWPRTWYSGWLFVGASCRAWPN